MTVHQIMRKIKLSLKLYILILIIISLQYSPLIKILIILSPSPLIKILIILSPNHNPSPTKRSISSIHLLFLLLSINLPLPLSFVPQLPFILLLSWLNRLLNIILWLTKCLIILLLMYFINIINMIALEYLLHTVFLLLLNSSSRSYLPQERIILLEYRQVIIFMRKTLPLFFLFFLTYLTLIPSRIVPRSH